ncbi:MAG: hypothetical protein QX189_16290 [Methylococcales bacterium]
MKCYTCYFIILGGIMAIVDYLIFLFVLLKVCLPDFLKYIIAIDVILIVAILIFKHKPHI